MSGTIAIAKTIDFGFGMTFYPLFKYLYYYFRSKPQFIKIETTNFCNAQCLYCPHSAMERKKGMMQDHLFKKIVAECVDWGIKEIHLCNFGEALLDKKLSEKIKYIKKRDASIKTVIFTNGNLLDNETSTVLLSAGIDRITVSFDGYSPEYFEKYRTPLKYDVVFNNIKDLIKVKKELNSKTQLILNAVYSSDSVSQKEVENFKEDWKDEPVTVNLQKLHEWHGYVPNSRYNYKNITCRDIYEYMTINWDGSVVPCCLDYDGACVLGDASKEHIRSIWFGTKFVNFRRMLLKDMKAMEMCEQCGYRIYNVRFPYVTSFLKMMAAIKR